MSRQPATPDQMVRDKLLNRKPVPCPVCDHYISPGTGLPVIFGTREKIIEFVHPSCCAPAGIL